MKVVVGLLSILSAMVRWARGTRQVRHSASDALTARDSLFSQIGGTSGVVRRAASVRTETQLGVVDVLLAFDSSAVNQPISR